MNDMDSNALISYLTKKSEQYDAIKWGHSFLRFGIGECKKCPFRREVCANYCQDAVLYEDKWLEEWKKRG